MTFACRVCGAQPGKASKLHIHMTNETRKPCSTALHKHQHYTRTDCLTVPQNMPGFPQSIACTWSKVSLRVATAPTGFAFALLGL